MSEPNSTTQAREALSLAIGSQQTAHDLFNEADVEVKSCRWTTPAEVKAAYKRRHAAHQLYTAATYATNAAADRYVAAKCVPVSEVAA